MNRHQRRKTACLKRRDRRATIRRVLLDPVAAPVVLAEWDRRTAEGLPEPDGDLFRKLRPSEGDK